jgi:glycosyltransferase involved in cell wall biosynthesis
MFSVLILTFNEQHDLPGCLDALHWCDDVVVYDSFSTDQTEYIARSAGARFVQRPGQDLSVAFGGDEATHRSWGLRHIPFTYPWLLVLDADERLSEDALHEIRTILSNCHGRSFPHLTEPVAYQLRRRDFLEGRHLKHVQATPWYIRFFRPEFVSYDRLINPVTVVTGNVGSLRGYIEHYPFSKGLSHWITRHNTYSTLEAQQFLSVRCSPIHHLFWSSLFSSEFHQRRVSQKQLFMHMPARPLLKFLILYFFKCGFLDGTQGLTYALLQSIYEYFIVLKLREIKLSVDSHVFPTP